MHPRRRFIAAGLSAVALTASRHAFADESGWPVASPDSQGIDASALQRVFDGASDRTGYALEGVTVVRDGVLIGERYFGRPPSSLFVINSITKSVASMLVGIALGQGKLKSLDQTMGELLPEAAAKRPDSPVNRVTLWQILTQTSGLEDIPGGSLVLSPDPVAQVFGQVAHPADPSVWAYCDAAVSLIGPILARATGLSLEAYARQVLFSPLGIDRFGWDHDSTGNATSWVGLKLSPRDLVKIAWVMADGGRWHGAQIVPADWVEQSTRSHASPTWRVPPMTVEGYGYLWFTGTIRGHAAVWGWGYGAQFTLFVPSLRLAIATASDVPNYRNVGKQNAKVMGVVAEIVALAT